MKTSNDLLETLKRIDRRGYPAYKDTAGRYQFNGYVLSIDHVQGDPFAAPSRVSVIVSGKNAGFPSGLYNVRHRRTALQDYLLRSFGRRLEQSQLRGSGSGKSGLMAVSRCGQEIIERSACSVDVMTGEVTVRMEIGFPANGRTINAGGLIKMLFEMLPACVEHSLAYRSLDACALKKNADLADDQYYIRQELEKQGLAAFVADGSILPRESGVSSRPLKGAVPFKSPRSLEITLKLPHHGELKGMGIRRGVFLIVGGGYHGKSTLLKSIEQGVYNHIAGDGREYVITDDTAVKIRAEDGRSIKKTDISMFISGLPNGRDTTSFSTEDASGSTSQAANVMEAAEAGSRVLLIDEDTAATNFMIRDELMQRVVHRSEEPITPFIDRIREMYEKHGISTILVAGSSGSYFYKADVIIQMDSYMPEDITQRAKAEAESFGGEPQDAPAFSHTPAKRCPRPERLRSDGERVDNTDGRGGGSQRHKIKATGCDTLMIDRNVIDLRYLEQLVSSEQLTALGYLYVYAQTHLFDGRRSMGQITEELSELIDEQGFEALCGGYIPVNMAYVRPQEIAACINRNRELRL